MELEGENGSGLNQPNSNYLDFRQCCSNPSASSRFVVVAAAQRVSIWALLRSAMEPPPAVRASRPFQFGELEERRRAQLRGVAPVASLPCHEASSFPTTSRMCRFGELEKRWRAQLRGVGDGRHIPAGGRAALLAARAVVLLQDALLQGLLPHASVSVPSPSSFVRLPLDGAEARG